MFFSSAGLIRAGGSAPIRCILVAETERARACCTAEELLAPMSRAPASALQCRATRALFEADDQRFGLLASRALKPDHGCHYPPVRRLPTFGSPIASSKPLRPAALARNMFHHLERTRSLIEKTSPRDELPPRNSTCRRSCVAAVGRHQWLLRTVAKVWSWSKWDAASDPTGRSIFDCRFSDTSAVYPACVNRREYGCGMGIDHGGVRR